MDGKLGPTLREAHALRVFLEQVAGEDIWKCKGQCNKMDKIL
jgi:hypothetical protein